MGFETFRCQKNCRFRFWEAKAFNCFWQRVSRRFKKSCLGCYIGLAKELGVIYFHTNYWGAKEPQNLPNHRVDEERSFLGGTFSEKEIRESYCQSCYPHEALLQMFLLVYYSHRIHGTAIFTLLIHHSNQQISHSWIGKYINRMDPMGLVISRVIRWLPLGTYFGCKFCKSHSHWVWQKAARKDGWDCVQIF